jgi:hypothetical protein
MRMDPSLAKEVIMERKPIASNKAAAAAAVGDERAPAAAAARLEARLAAVGRVLAASGQGLALLGLGSAGVETDRLDQWSDLDFFVVVKPGHKEDFLRDGAWLSAPAPLDWLFRNTADGFKLLWSDGIFAEMAVFEAAELAGIPFAPGRVVWSEPGFDTACLRPTNQGGRLREPGSLPWLRGELLSCLYVGLCRYRRGERLSAWRFIQGYCLDRYLEIVELTRQPAAAGADAYVRDRRFEQRYPEAAALLSGLLAGYGQTPAAALAFLDWLDAAEPVNPGMKREIRRLAGG